MNVIPSDITRYSKKQEEMAIHEKEKNQSIETDQEMTGIQMTASASKALTLLL